MKRVFADTVFWIAMLDPGDSLHARGHFCLGSRCWRSARDQRDGVGGNVERVQRCWCADAVSGCSHGREAARSTKSRDRSSNARSLRGCLPAVRFTARQGLEHGGLCIICHHARTSHRRGSYLRQRFRPGRISSIAAGVAWYSCGVFLKPRQGNSCSMRSSCASRGGTSVCTIFQSVANSSQLRDMDSLGLHLW